MDNTDDYKAGRRGYHTGQTLRRSSTNNPVFYKGQFSIHKTLTIHDGIHRTHEEIEAISKTFADCIDDGGLEATTSYPNAWMRRRHQVDGLPYSQNKRKRWLLSSLLKDNILDTDCHDDLDFKVILEEREVSHPLVVRCNKADCIRVCESKTEQPEKVPTYNKYSYASDLRKKNDKPARRRRRRHHRDEFEEDPPPVPPKIPEVYYEICYPKADAISPWSKFPLLTDTWDKKEKANAKGQRKLQNRYYHYCHGIADVEPYTWDAQEVWEDDDEIRQDAGHDYMEEVSLEDMLECFHKKSHQKYKTRKRGKKVGWISESKNNTSQCHNQISANPVKLHGKGATIYEEQPDTNTDDDMQEDDVAVADALVTPATDSEQDIRLTQILNISTRTISPDHLKETYGSAYIESMCDPRRFAIDISHQSSTGTDGDVYVLFEMVEDVNKNSLSYRWDDMGCEDWQHLDEYRSVRVSLIVSPQFFALNFTDLPEGMHAGIGNSPTVADVIRWLTAKVNDKMAATVSENSDSKKTYKHRVAMDTVTKASGWKLKVDTPYGVYQDIQQETKDVNQQDKTDFVMEFNPFCGICFESLLPSVGGLEATAPTVCGHWFCNECWKQHLRSRVNQGDINIICPGYDCKSAIDIVTKMSLMSNTTFYNHIDHIRNAAINRKTEWQWCPNPKCGRMACVLDGSVGVVVDCECGWLWCSQCMEEAHWPATCKQASDYRDMLKVKAHRENRSALIECVEVKRCPQCKYPMEKNGGCPHMSCRMCGCGFCWRCLGLWNAHRWEGINSVCPNSKADLETVMLQSGKIGRNILLIKDAMHHRDMRCKTNIKRYHTLNYKLVAKEFLKRTDTECLNSKRSMVLPSDQLIQGDYVDNLPVTWAMTQTKLDSLIDMAHQGQQCVQICIEAHFVLEYLAVYMSDNTLGRRHRKQFNLIANHLQFVTQRIDEILNERSNWAQTRLLMQSGRRYLQKLACAMNNIQTMAKTE